MTNDTSKVISLADRRAKKEEEARNSPIPGWIIWLQCTECKSLEYTEVLMTGGRVHKCGTLVNEIEVPIDIRAEYTISLRNSEKLDKFLNDTKIPGLFKPLLKKGMGVIESLQAVENEYQLRLKNIANGEIKPYEDSWQVESLGESIKTVDPIGIILTEARQSELHFPETLA